MSNSYEFYLGRISSCPSYGFRSGHELLQVILRCAYCDLSLTVEQFNSIIKKADLAHIKMMEDEYNAGWKDE